MKKINWVYLALVAILSGSSPALGQGTMGGSAEWEKVVSAARKEGKVVVSFPSSCLIIVCVRVLTCCTFARL